MEKSFEFNKEVFDKLSAHYNFEFGYKDDEFNLYRISYDFLNRLKEKNVVSDLDSVCNTLFSKPFSGVSESSEMRRFLANGEYEIDFNLPFDKYYTFRLSSEAVLNSHGDVIEIHYKKNKSDTKSAICEFRSYNRTTWGEIPNDEYKILRTVKIRYYKENGTYLERVFADQELNEYERKKLDRKGRTNVIELIRHYGGEYIKNFYIGEMMAGRVAPADIQTTILRCAGEALHMIEVLNDEISTYRDDRKSDSLIAALNVYPRTELLKDNIINYIRDYVNIQYYTKID